VIVLPEPVINSRFGLSGCFKLFGIEDFAA